jgi:U3 small nucleolar RNA-associated protein 13
VNFFNHGTQLVSSGSDGLLKLWTIKTGECIETLDAHTDKVWSLSVGKDDVYIASGGADSLIQIWQDYSEKEEENQRAAQELKLRSEETLANCLLKKDYRNAMLIAISLQQPFRLFSIFNDLLESPTRSELERDQLLCMVRELITSLTSDQISTLFSFIRDWNTNAKYCFVSQSLLHMLFQAFPPSYFTENNKSMRTLLEALIPYTERHFQRAHQLFTNSFIVDYTLQSMDLLLGPLHEEDL